jgi:hypothetical protein
MVAMFLVLALLLLCFTPALAQAPTPSGPDPKPPVDITAGMTLVIGFLATIISQAVKLYAAKAGKPLDRKIVTVFMLAMAVILAYIWAKPLLPELPVWSSDPGQVAIQLVQYLEEFCVVLSGVVGFAVILYNLLGEKVFDLLGIGKEKIKALAAPELKAD